MTTSTPIVEPTLTPDEFKARHGSWAETSFRKPTASCDVTQRGVVFTVVESELWICLHDRGTGDTLETPSSHTAHSFAAYHKDSRYAPSQHLALGLTAAGAARTAWRIWVVDEYATRARAVEASTYIEPPRSVVSPTPGDVVWIHAYGRWRCAIVAATFKVRATVVFATATGSLHAPDVLLTDTRQL